MAALSKKRGAPAHGAVELLTRSEAGARIRASRSTVDRLIALGTLAAIKIGGRTMVRASEVRRFIDEAPPVRYRPIKPKAASTEQARA